MNVFSLFTVGLHNFVTQQRMFTWEDKHHSHLNTADRWNYEGCELQLQQRPSALSSWVPENGKILQVAGLGEARELHTGAR